MSIRAIIKSIIIKHNINNNNIVLIFLIYLVVQLKIICLNYKYLNFKCNF